MINFNCDYHDQVINSKNSKNYIMNQITYSICGVFKIRKPPLNRGNTSSAK